MKQIAKRITIILVTFLLLEALLLSAIEVLITFSEVRLDISADIVLQNLQEMFVNIPTVISTYWQQRNPLFIVGTIVVFIYSIVLHKGSLKKSGWDTETENAYHGSARWAKANEIFDKVNFHKSSKQKIQSEFKKSLNRSDK